MSWHFSRALVEAYSAGISSDGDASAPSNSTSTQGMCWSPGKTTGVSRRSRSGMIYEPLTDDRGAVLLTWCLEDSRAKTSARAEGGRELTEDGLASGLKWRELSVRYDRGTSSWKTHRCLFAEVLRESWVIFPKWGRMTADGACWERVTLPLRIYAGAAGLSRSWPSPLARDWKDTPGMALEGTNRNGTLRRRTDTLPRAVWNAARKMYPTPRATEGGPDYAKQKRGKRTGQSTSPSLATIVAMEGGPFLGPLNPTFREWLMGWPIGWTEKKPLATGRFREWLHSHGKL